MYIIFLIVPRLPSSAVKLFVANLYFQYKVHYTNQPIAKREQWQLNCMHALDKFALVKHHFLVASSCVISFHETNSEAIKFKPAHCICHATRV